MATSDDVTTYHADGPPCAQLVLAHGAGADERHPFMVSTARGLAARGIDVITFDFPYMRQRRKVPDKTPVLEAAFRDAVAWARERSRKPDAPLFIGGKSMGGRMATQLAAQGVDGLAGVVVLGYPLHPPGKPEQLRAAHLPRITAPCLIVQGERDTFGTPDELRPVLGTMTAPVTLHIVAGGDHSLAVRGAAKEAVMNGWLDVIGTWMTATR